MNCFEAQSKIMAFIENKLPDEELREFIKHVRNCDNCAEELEIYYTLIVGMKQLDESDVISVNFLEELEQKMDDEMTRMTAVKRIATSTIMIVMAAIVAGLVWLYSGVLDKVYRYDQRAKFDEQPKYMYAKSFEHEIFKENDNIVKYLDGKKKNDNNDSIISDDGIQFMSNVKSYNVTHMTYKDVLSEEEDKNNEENIDN